MRLRPAIPVLLLSGVLAVGLFAFASAAFQYGEWRGYGVSSFQSNEKAEFSWSRLRYNSRARSFGGYGYGYGYGNGKS